MIPSLAAMMRSLDLGNGRFTAGAYATLSFIPTLGTMILGLIAGGVLRSQRAPWAKVEWLVFAGLAGLAVGALLNGLGICPLVKRIWTPSWTLFSGGWCLLLSAEFHVLMDIRGCKCWAFPLVVVGMNSIAAYVMAHLSVGFISQNLTTHLGPNDFKFLGDAYEPLVKGVLVLMIMWGLLFWMHRRKIFLADCGHLLDQAGPRLLGVVGVSGRTGHGRIVQ